MAMPFLIIDGYNLMHAAGMARARYGPGELEKRRMRFLKFLSDRLSPEQTGRTTVVFDAADAPAGASRRATIDELEVLFAPEGGDADTLIEELIAAHSAPRQVRVVSGDRRLQTAARRRRSSYVDSESFIAELQRQSSQSKTGRSRRMDRQLEAKYSGRIVEEDTEEWLAVFGEILEAEELTEEADRWQARVDELFSEEEDLGDAPSRQ